MTVFICHAPADRKIAEGLEKVLERRGHFVELDDGQAALRPVQSADVVVMLVSKDFAFSPGRLRLEQRALDAWTEGRLELVKLDNAFAPVGLRDLPATDASFEAQREFKWGELATSITSKLQAPARKLDAAPPPASESRQRGPAPQAPARKKRGGAGWLGVLFTLVLMLPGLFALAVAGSIWLANRIGPAPGTFADLLAGIDAFGMRYGAPSGVTVIVFAAAIALMVLAPVLLIAGRVARKARRDAEARENPDLYTDYESAPQAGPVGAAAPASDAVFVSYARANAPLVLPVIEAVKRLGRRFWLDQDGIGAGDSWAGEIVRAIKGAPGVMVMCSQAAFESDHVKREIYLADRYKKRLVPVFVEDATPPEDFEYFFAGVQFLKLFETPEAERPAAVMRVLGANP